MLALTLTLLLHADPMPAPAVSREAQIEFE